MAPRVHVLEDGLVHIPAAVDEASQQVLAHVARTAGGRGDGAVNGGFWCRDGSGGEMTMLNHSPSWGRGRVFAALDRFPCAAELRDICESVVTAACRADSSMPRMSPTHLLLNYYGKGCGITTHIDSAENDGEGDRPVVSISLGNTCNFELKHKRHAWKDGYTCDTPPGPCHRVPLSSSDALLFGGTCRMLQHTIVGRTFHDGTFIRAITPKTAPANLDLGEELLPGHGVRVSFTFRESHDLIGSEHKYINFKATTAQRKRKFQVEISLSTSTTTSPMDGASDTYFVNSILGKRTRKGKVEYRVRWEGFPASESTWEPLSHLKSAMKLVRAFESNAGKKRKRNRQTVAARSSVQDPLVGTRVEKRFGTSLYGGQ
eukprot:COSAG02_NODE_88_length_38629_cov_457.967999_12_plen_374_part_00